MELEDEEKEDQNRREYDCRRRREAKKIPDSAAEAKRSKGGEGVLGRDRRRARTPRRCRTTLTVESRHRRRSHAHSRAGAWTASCRRRAARDGACDAGFRRGGHRRVDRPPALRNLWFSSGEELPGKSPAAVTAAARRKSGDGEGDRNETRSLENKIRFSLWL